MEEALASPKRIPSCAGIGLARAFRFSAFASASSALRLRIIDRATTLQTFALQLAEGRTQDFLFQ